MRTPGSVILVAASELLGSLVILYLSGGTLWAVVRNTQLYPDSHQTLSPGFIAVFVVIPLLLSILGIVSSLGLLSMREWARKATLLLAAVAVIFCLLLVLMRPPSLFPPGDQDKSIMTLGGSFLLWLFEVLLVVLVPVSAWWGAVLTSGTVRGYFQKGHERT